MIHYVHQPNMLPGGYAPVQTSICGKSISDRHSWKHRMFNVNCAECIKVFNEKKEEFEKINHVCGICGKELTVLEKALINPKDMIRTCSEHKQFAGVAKLPNKK